MARLDIINQDTISRADHRNANIGAKFDIRVQKMFSLYLWEPVVGKVVAAPNLDPADIRTTAEYFFFTPPKTVSIEEPFATRIVGTQNGGKFVESHGSIFKSIRVQGTTGFRPRAGMPASTPGPISLGTNIVSAFADSIHNTPTTIPKEEITGFDDAMFLKNIFRLYSDLRASGTQVLMIWRDLKDDEEWVVEPKQPRIEKTSKSPLTYNYSFELTGLAKYSPATAIALASLHDSLNFDTKFANLLTDIVEIRNQMVRALYVVATQINRVSGFVSRGADLLLGTMTQAVRALEAIGSSLLNLRNNAARTYADVKGFIKDALGVVITAWEELTEHASTTATVLPDSTDNTLEIRQALVRSSAAYRAVLLALGSSDSVANSHRVRSINTRAAYKASDVLGSNVLSTTPPGAPGGSPTPEGVEEGRVLAGETIRDVAARLLGDSRRWYDLVLLNDLTAPYTSDSASLEDGVLAPGDAILFPSRKRSSSTNSISSVSPDEDSRLLESSLAARVYGRDFRLMSNDLGSGVTASDLTINQNGDISSIAGVDNVNQAVLIKFSTERGELPSHPSFGALASIGSKLDTVSFNTFRNSTLATFLSDPRIDTVSNLNFTTTGDVLGVSATLGLSKTSDYLSTNFALRRL